MNMFLKAIALSAISLITVHCKSTSSESALQSRKQDKDNWYGISTNGVKYDGRTGKIVFSVKKYACQRGYKPEYKIEVGACAESFPADCSVSLQYDLDRNPDGPGHGNCYLEDSDVSFVFANTKLNSQYYSGATLTLATVGTPTHPIVSLRCLRTYPSAKALASKDPSHPSPRKQLA